MMIIVMRIASSPNASKRFLIIENLYIKYTSILYIDRILFSLVFQYELGDFFKRTYELLFLNAIDMFNFPRES